MRIFFSRQIPPRAQVKTIFERARGVGRSAPRVLAHSRRARALPNARAEPLPARTEAGVGAAPGRPTAALGRMPDVPAKFLAPPTGSAKPSRKLGGNKRKGGGGGGAPKPRGGGAGKPPPADGDRAAGHHHHHSDGVSRSASSESRSDAGTDDDESGRSPEPESEDEGADGYKRGGYHPVRVGEKYKDGRYVVRSKLGWGHFSTCWLCDDRETGARVALKVQKSAPHYTEAARDEIDILARAADEFAVDDGEAEEERSRRHHRPGRARRQREEAVKAAEAAEAAEAARRAAAGAGEGGTNRPATLPRHPGSKCVVKLLDSFEHDGPNGRHVCMAFEVLGDNLLALIKRYDYRGVPLRAVKAVCRDVLLGLDYLHARKKIIHTDLKPENVLLLEPLPGREDEDDRDRAGGVAGETNARAHVDDALAAPNGESAEAEAAKAEAEVAKMDISAASDAAGLTKNQRRKAKKKAKKAAAAAAEGPSSGPGPAGGDAKTPPPCNRAGAKPRESAPARSRSRGPAPSREYLDRVRCRVVDLGNACWTYKQFTQDIQTRQYRCPEVILGAKYGTPADVWSVACIAFELATGDLLFDPRGGKEYDRDEDHLALMMELVGKMPRKIALGGARSREFFNRGGELRHIRSLKFWSARDVLREKYAFGDEEAAAFASFLEPMLEFAPERRATAAAALAHPWLAGVMAGVDLAGTRGGGREAAPGRGEDEGTSGSPGDGDGTEEGEAKRAGEEKETTPEEGARGDEGEGLDER